MALSDHFREFRARLMRCLLVFVVVLAVALVFRHVLLDLVSAPTRTAQAHAPGRAPPTRPPAAPVPACCCG